VAEDPRHRFSRVSGLVEQAAPAPEPPLEAALYELLSTGTCSDGSVTYAYDLYQIETHRAAIDAFTLAKVETAQVSTTLEIPVEVVRTYQHLFMDTTAFRNRLELTSYAAEYQGNAYGVELVRTAVVVGLEYLLWAFGTPTENIDNRVVVRRTMIDAFFRGMAHKGNPVTSATAKEALKWWSTAISNAQVLEKIDPRSARSAFDDLRIALEKKDSTCSVEQAPVPVSEILH
jgi:hypothetical protein